MRVRLASCLAFLAAFLAFLAACSASAEPVRVYLMLTTATAPLGSVTELQLINTSGEELRFTGDLFNHRGEALGTAGASLSDAPLAPGARLALTSAALETRFDTEAWTQPAMLEVSADVENASFVAMLRLRSAPHGWTTNVNCVAQGAVHSVEGIDQLDSTYIRFVNTTDERITNIRGTLRDADGDVVGTANRRLLASLQPKAGAWLSAARLAQLVGSRWSGQASLYVSHHPGLKLMNLNIIGNETFVNFSCLDRAPNMRGMEATARYSVTFTARWNAADHGTVPSGAHFTTLAGAAVNADADLWVPGELATSGLENLAELGQTSTFLAEIAAKTDAGDAGESVTSSGTGATGTSVFELTVSRDLPNFTFGSMIAPSPDWFVGLSEFPLLDGEGRWIEDTGDMGLPAWDAGTETGTEFSLSGTATNPAQPISLLTETVGGTVEFDRGTIGGSYLATIRLRRIP